MAHIRATQTGRFNPGLEDVLGHEEAGSYRMDCFSEPHDRTNQVNGSRKCVRVHSLFLAWNGVRYLRKTGAGDLTSLTLDLSIGVKGREIAIEADLLDQLVKD